jgi:hypothetical protein
METLRMRLFPRKDLVKPDRAHGQAVVDSLGAYHRKLPKLLTVDPV